MKYGILIFAFMTTLGTVLLGSTGISAAAKYEFTFSTTATPDSYQGEAEKTFLEEVEKATNGEVSFHIAWGSSLVSATESLRAVADGVVDLAKQNSSFYPRQLLYNNALSILQRLPVGYLERIDLFKKYLSALPEIRDEFTKYNQTIVYAYSVTHLCLVSTMPMTKIEDVKGRKVRAASRWQLNLLRELGATPVSVPFADVPMSLQTNVLDATLFSLDAIEMAGLGDVAPNILMIPQLGVGTPYFITINTDKFNSLPQEIRTKFAEAAKAAEIRFAARDAEICANIMKRWADRSFNVTVAGPEFIEKWLALPTNKSNVEDWVREAEADGAKDARAIVNTVFQYVDEAVAAENAKKK